MLTQTKKQVAIRTMPGLMPKAAVSQIAAELQVLQRKRAIVIKSRNMIANRNQAVVAGTLGYDSRASDKERQKKFAEAAAFIKEIRADKHQDYSLQKIVRAALVGISAFEEQKKDLESVMLKLARQLPVAGWVQQPEQRGFGLLFLAIVIGETGNLANYSGPYKVYKRLGCAPWSFDGQTLMGATWKSGRQGKLPASEWESFGYSPRRRSIAYLIGEGLVKQNFLTNGHGELALDTEQGDVVADENGAGESHIDTEAVNAGPYRARYLRAKADFQARYPNDKPLRHHRHGMLLATKMLLKHLWCAWNDREVR